MITYAQETTVTGKVTAGGEEMPGVTVAVKGQTRGHPLQQRPPLPL